MHLQQNWPISLNYFANYDVCDVNTNMRYFANWSVWAQQLCDRVVNILVRTHCYVTGQYYMVSTLSWSLKTRQFVCIVLALFCAIAWWVLGTGTTGNNLVVMCKVVKWYKAFYYMYYIFPSDWVQSFKIYGFIYASKEMLSLHALGSK